ncbi:MAG: S8 family serine peptidase [Thermoplasmata archaeon]
MAEAGADVISFSFGDADNGDGESGFTRYLDAIVDVLGVPVVVGALNFGPGENTVGTPADAFNGITVGNMNDNRTPSRGDDDLHPASGWGPTGDGRRKPDLVAPGTGISSTSNHWDTGPPFVTMTGTSMATPHVAGAISLLLGFLGEPAFPALHKALLLNTADDQGPPGFDVKFGWGYVNLTRAFGQRNHNVVANLSGERPYRLYTVGMGEGDRATLAWQRHVFVGGLGSTDFFADLDLEAYLEETHELLGSSNSTAENVEQVAPGGPHRPVVLKVAAGGPLDTEEKFALATSQSLSEARPPTLEVDVSLPCAVVMGDEVGVTASIRNAGELSVRNLASSLEGAGGLDLVVGAMNGSFASVEAGEVQLVRWTFRAPSEGEWSLSLNVSGAAFGVALSAAAQGTVIVQPTSSPFVREFRAFPMVQGIGEEVLFEATICAGAGIQEAYWALLAAEGSEVSNRSMEGGPDPSRFSHRQTFWSLGTHGFRITGRDGDGLWVTVEGNVTILDRRAPDILQPVVLPSVSEWGAPIKVRARVLDNSTIESVGVSIVLLGESEETNITLLPTSEGHWEAQLTPPKPGSHTAVISATDAVGITGTATLTFRVVQGLPPIAGIDGPSEAQLDVPVTFSGHPSSDDFGVASFAWVIEGPGEAGEKVTRDGETMEHTFTQPGSYRVILLVSDFAGNLGLAEEHVRVQAPPASSSFPPWIPYVILVSAVSLVAGLWIWRRKSR